MIENIANIQAIADGVASNQPASVLLFGFSDVLTDLETQIDPAFFDVINQIYAILDQLTQISY